MDILDLQRRIEEVQRSIERKEKLLKAHPNDFVLEIGIRSLERHLDRLNDQAEKLKNKM